MPDVIFDSGIFRDFPQFLGRSIGNSFRKDQPYTASQAEVLCGKQSYADPLFVRVSSKSGENIGIHMFLALFIQKTVFYFSSFLFVVVILFFFMLRRM